MRQLKKVQKWWSWSSGWDYICLLLLPLSAGYYAAQGLLPTYLYDSKYGKILGMNDRTATPIRTGTVSHVEQRTNNILQNCDSCNHRNIKYFDSKSYCSTITNKSCGQTQRKLSRMNAVAVRPVILDIFKMDKDHDNHDKKHHTQIGNSSQVLSSSNPAIVDTQTAIPLHSTASSSNLVHKQNATSTIWTYRKELWKMSRPGNFPGIVLFHFLGVFMVVRSYVTVLRSSILQTQSKTVMSVFISLSSTQPGLWITLLAILLVSSTSMIVNDYYDAKLGNDECPIPPTFSLPSSSVPTKTDTMQQPCLWTKGNVPLDVARKVLSELYGLSLVVLAFVPGITARLSVVTGLILTYLYTKHLKPRTWTKNIVCATLIAVSPLASGSAAIYSLLQQAQTSPFPVPHIKFPMSLLRFVGTVFFGIFGREVMMDCNDEEADARSKVRTIPVVYGKQYATRVALATNLIVAIIALSGPIFQLYQVSSNMIGGAIDAASRNTINVILRRLLLASLGSILTLYRGVQVVGTGGAVKLVNDRAVEDGTIAILFFVASML